MLTSADQAPSALTPTAHSTAKLDAAKGIRIHKATDKHSAQLRQASMLFLAVTMLLAQQQ
jgi:hypothetical protein